MTTAKVILVLGQSNAISFSTSGVAYPGGWTAPSFGAGYLEIAWTGAGWAQYVPGSTSYGAAAYWGPEASILLAKRAVTPLCQTYVYKYAVGGVGVEGGWWPYGGATFNAFVVDLTAALAGLTGAGLTVEIDECYWIGNESDCFSWSNASALAHDMPALVAAIRTRFSSPSMKFIAARTKSDLGSASGPLPYVDIVRTAQMACGTRTAWVNTDDFGNPTISLGHYNPVDIVTLGTRLFTAAEAIT